MNLLNQNTHKMISKKLEKAINDQIQLEERSPVKFTLTGSLFWLIHLLPLLAFLPGIEVTFFDWMTCLFLYYFRMFFTIR